MSEKGLGVRSKGGRRQTCDIDLVRAGAWGTVDVGDPKKAHDGCPRADLVSNKSDIPALNWLARSFL